MLIVVDSGLIVKIVSGWIDFFICIHIFSYSSEFNNGPKKQKKVARPPIFCPHVASRLLIGSEPNFGRVGDIPNVITHAKCEII